MRRGRSLPTVIIMARVLDDQGRDHQMKIFSNKYILCDDTAVLHFVKSVEIVALPVVSLTVRKPSTISLPTAVLALCDGDVG